MRFYALELYAPQENTQSVSVGVTLPTYQGPQSSMPNKNYISYPSKPTKVWTSYPNGEYDPKAQNIIFDILTFDSGLASSVYTITVEGVSFHDIQQHSNFRNYGLRLYAGMGPGLPLSNNQPAPGIVAQGYVKEAIGRWQGTEMTVTFVVVPDIFDLESPGNLVFVWSPGQSFANAISSTLDIAYPNFTKKIMVSDNLSTPGKVVHYASNFMSLALFIKELTKKNINSSYSGVSMYIQNGDIFVTDESTFESRETIQLKYDDLIGQPVWAEAGKIDIFTMMRADISVANNVKMPVVLMSVPGLVVENPSIENTAYNYELSFFGKFLVNSIRQIGNFRMDNANAWCSVIRCAAEVAVTNASSQ